MTTHRFCVTREDFTEIVEISGDLPETIGALIARFNDQMVHIVIVPGDILWTHDTDFNCDVILTRVNQGRKITVRTRNKVGAEEEQPVVDCIMPRTTTMMFQCQPTPIETRGDSHHAGCAAFLPPVSPHRWKQSVSRTIASAPGSDCTTPLRIFLVRHGESEANVNKKVYDDTPDHAVSLTERGKAMAFAAGSFLRRFLISKFKSKRDVDHHIRMYVSPFRRTRETAEGMLSALNDSREQWVDDVRESTLLVEQDWGVLEGEGKIAKAKYQEEMDRIGIKGKHDGRFYSRLPNGESCFDVCQRVSGLIPDIMNVRNVPTSERKVVRTVIIVSHGVTCRAFLAMWTRLSPEWFHHSMNPPNCSIQMLQNEHDKGYIYGGFEERSTAEPLVPMSVSHIRTTVDPQHTKWNMYLNQVAGSANGLEH